MATESQKMVRAAQETWASLEQLVDISKEFVSKDRHRRLREFVKREAKGTKVIIDACPRPGNCVDADLDDLGQVLEDIGERPNNTEEVDR